VDNIAGQWAKRPMQVLVAVSGAIALANPACSQAADLYSPLLAISEARLGVNDHNIESHGNESGVDLKGELLLGRLPGAYSNPLLEALLQPRPHLGGNFNLSGDTSFGYFGLTWDFELSPRFFIEASFGGAVHDGPLDERGRMSFGCRVNFHEQATLGYKIDRNWRLLASVEHMSNGDLCEPNRGLTNAGVRIGYRFD
jgi:lipid A 3-O-deacylase